MKKSGFAEEQRALALRQAESGTAIQEITRGGGLTGSSDKTVPDDAEVRLDF